MLPYVLLLSLSDPDAFYFKRISRAQIRSDYSVRWFRTLLLNCLAQKLHSFQTGDSVCEYPVRLKFHTQLCESSIFTEFRIQRGR